jgi:predicted ArsR family transcriptional regulator
MERAVAALRDLTRRDILLRFYTEPHATSVEEVARSAGIHRSVAFDHLERLVGLGYLDTELRRGLVGKPAKLYRLASGPVLISHPPRSFDALARELAMALESLGLDGYQAARRAGREFAAEFTRSPQSDLNAALKDLAGLGGEYEAEGDDVVAHNCVFLEACAGEGVVCEFHAGLLEGATGRRLEPGGRWGPFGCRYRLAATWEGARTEDETAAG